MVHSIAGLARPLTSVHSTSHSALPCSHLVAWQTFKKDKAVEKALAMTGQMLGGREIVIGINTKPPKAKGGATGSLRVFVGNLPFDATEPAVRKHFASCGRILFVRYALDHEGKPKGFCHVIFEDPPQSKGAALHAALALNGSTLLERNIVVGAAPPQQKAKRAPKRGSAVDSTSVDSSHNREREKKRMRPADWRLDRAAGLTLPRAAAWHEPQEGAAAHESW